MHKPFTPSLRLAGLASLVILCAAPTVHAQTKAQKNATQAFRDCREMEGFGDATPCWRRYLDKHRAAGNEAEIMVAEERVSKGAPPKGAPPSNEQPKEQPKAAPKEEPPPAEETPVEEAEAPPPEAAPDVAVVPVAITVDGPDLCGTSGKQKRAVIFGFAGTEAFDKDAKFAQAEAPRHMNEVFLERFPNPRFQNVTTTLAGDAKWSTADSLPLADVKKHVVDNASAGEAASALEQALGCADFVAFATLTSVSSEPGDGPAGVDLRMTGTMGVFAVHGETLDLLSSFEASVPSMFDKAEDAAATTAASSLDGATSSIDSANQQAASAGQMADQAGDAAGAVGDAASSVAEGEVPEGVAVGAGSEECQPAEPPAEGEAPAEPQCEPKPEEEPLIEKPTAGDAHERTGSLCVESAKSKDPGSALACEVRVRAYMMAKSFKESSLELPGWQLSATLLMNDDRYGIALGEAENLSVGDRFVVLDDEGNRKAYFRVQNLGPGGAEGEQSMSEVALRLGEASAGDTVSELSMLGLGIQVHGGAMFFPVDSPHYAPYGAIQASEDVWVQQKFALPQLMFGGGGALSYDMSWLVGWSEFSVRLGGEYLMGNGTATQATLIETELVAEKGFYLGTGLELYVGLGPTMTIAKVRSVPFYNPIILGQEQNGELVAVNEIPGQVVDFRSMLFGATAMVGFEYLLTPHVALRAEFPFRFSIPQGYDKGTPPQSTCPSDLSDPDSTLESRDSSLCWGYDTREDTYASGGGRLGALVMF
jgi:hypothetical protein